VGGLDKPHLWGQIATTAGWQHGHVTRRQIVALGVSTTSVDRWLTAGRLVRVHAGVYAVGYRRVEPVAVAMAAVLACGDGAVLSHDSAAALYGWRRWPPMPEVTSRSPARRPGICGHRTRSLPSSDCTRQLGVPVTAAARTINDLKPRLTRRQFTRMVNDARRERRISAEAVVCLLGYTTGPTRSEFEAAFLRFCRRFGLPAPQTLVIVEGYEVDALFERHRVVVELDGWQYHDDRAAFAADRERDATLLAAGYLTVRITWDRLRDTPAREAARLRDILNQRVVS
jgi:very-short-patch-repair endonuclease